MPGPMQLLRSPGRRLWGVPAAVLPTLARSRWCELMESTAGRWAVPHAPPKTVYPAQRDEHHKGWELYHTARQPCSLNSDFYTFTTLTMRKQKAQIILL